MLDLYFEDGWSPGRISSDPRFNRSIHTVKALIREAKLLGRVRKKKTAYDPRRRENWRPLSAAHVKLGVLVTRHMSVRSMNATDFGTRVNLTRNQVSLIGSGAFDLPLSALMRICVEIEVDVKEIFVGMHAGPIRAPAA